jgi:hypothetical protein
LYHFSITLIVTQYYCYVYIIIDVYYSSVHKIGNLCLILVNICIKHVKQFQLRVNIHVTMLIFNSSSISCVCHISNHFILPCFPNWDIQICICLNQALGKVFSFCNYIQFWLSLLWFQTWLFKTVVQQE